MGARILFIPSPLHSAKALFSLARPRASSRSFAPLIYINIIIVIIIIIIIITVRKTTIVYERIRPYTIVCIPSEKTPFRARSPHTRARRFFFILSHSFVPNSDNLCHFEKYFLAQKMRPLTLEKGFISSCLYPK